MYIVPVSLLACVSHFTSDHDQLALCVSHFVCGHFSGPSQFTITSVSIGACNDIIKVTYMEVSCVTIYSYWL